MLHPMSPLHPVLPAHPLRPSPSLEAFQQAAERSAQFPPNADGPANPAQFGPGPGGTPGVTWVQPLAGEDTTGMFIQALGQSFGEEMGHAIARELDLKPAPGHPLSVHDVHRAIEIGETGRPALEGVDFGARMTHSALADGPGFRRAADALGVDPARLDPATRHSIDTRMADRFARAAQAGLAPVPLAQAEEWLQSELIPLTK